MKFKIAKNVTLPLLKIKPNGAPAFVRFEAPMYVGKEIKGQEGKKKMEPATLAHVINLETGEECQIICPLLLRERLTENYPENAYVGKCFRVTLMREEGKKYNLVGIQEIIPEGDFPQPSAATFETADDSTGNRPQEGGAKAPGKAKARSRARA